MGVSPPVVVTVLPEQHEDHHIRRSIHALRVIARYVRREHHLEHERERVARAIDKVIETLEEVEHD